MQGGGSTGGAPGVIETSAPGPRRGLVRRKGHIGDVALVALMTAACMPLLFAGARILALPAGASLDVPGFDSLRPLGAWLNNHLTLDWVPPGDRAAILYLLLLPTAALLVSFARLTLGIRVLGLRAILMAISFRAIGVLPSLALILVVIGTIVLIRPWFRRIQLPLYARIGVIVCLSTLIMVGALMLAPWVGSEAVWSVAFFPVIIIAMLAESVARTMERDDAVMAIWRTVWTIVFALVIAIAGAPASRFTYGFPELIVTQLIAIVFVSEFFDLRLLEEWPARISRWIAGVRPWYTPKPKVAVVRNREVARVINRLGRPAPADHGAQSVQRLVDALRDQGFEVKVFEGDMKLLAELQEFLPSNPRDGTPGGIVLNLATGVQGNSRFCHVPAMLEMAGVPYTGPDPLGHAQLSDRFVLMTLLSRAMVPVPRHFLVSDPAAAPEMEFPAAARPRFEPDVDRIVLRSRQSMLRAVQKILAEHGQPALVEQIVLGRKLSVFLFGNDPIECLPVLEHSTGKDTRTSLAPLGESLVEQVLEVARAAYRASGCRDYARVDVRLTPLDELVVTDVKWAFSFARGDALDIAASAGTGFASVMRRIVTEAAKRYVAAVAARREAAASGVAPAPENPVAAP